MRSRLVPALLCGLALFASRAAGAPDPSERPVEPISTRQTVFSIPYQLEPTAADEAPAEVELQVSTDQGATWKLASKVKPDQPNFLFRAPHDGEYWFAMRTIDKQGKVRPEGPLQPGLKVSVDTVVPRLDLAGERGPGGEIIARWQAVDPNLRPESFKIEYQASPTMPWEPLSVDNNVPQAMRHTLVGEGSWWPKGAGGAITLRANITDQAGNSAVNQVQIKADPRAANDAVTPHTARTPPQPETPPRSSADGGPRAWPADHSSDRPLAGDGRLVSEPGDAGDRGSADSLPSRDPFLSRPGSQPPAGRNQGPSAQVVSQENRNRRPGQGIDLNLLPPGQQPGMVNSSSFELEYDVDSVGPSGIAKVELWGTRDAGQTWSSFAVDHDNRSPLPVRVYGEGVYGFRIVVQNGRGLGGFPPQSGDVPELWIVVDLTQPTARITGTDVGLDVGEVVIRWEASDELPDPRPISLSFSDKPGGPWTPIASGIENTGSYTWRLDNQVPDHTYLRLEMRDEAGNIGIFETPEPVSLERQRPQGFIRGVRPIGR